MKGIEKPSRTCQLSGKGSKAPWLRAGIIHMYMCCFNLCACTRNSHVIWIAYWTCQWFWKSHEESSKSGSQNNVDKKLGEPEIVSQQSQEEHLKILERPTPSYGGSKYFLKVSQLHLAVEWIWFCCLGISALLITKHSDLTRWAILLARFRMFMN